MRSFALVEMVVVSLILTLVVAMLFMALIMGQRSWSAGDTTTELRGQIIRAVMNMNKELSETAPGKTNLTSVGDSTNSIEFHLPQDIDGDGTIIDAIGQIEWSPNEVSYALNPSHYLIRNYEGTDSIIGTNITSLLFTRTQGRLIQIDITAQKANSSGQQVQIQEQAIIKMRN